MQSLQFTVVWVYCSTHRDLLCRVLCVHNFQMALEMALPDTRRSIDLSRVPIAKWAKCLEKRFSNNQMSLLARCSLIYLIIFGFISLPQSTCLCLQQTIANRCKDSSARSWEGCKAIARHTMGTSNVQSEISRDIPSNPIWTRTIEAFCSALRLLALFGGPNRSVILISMKLKCAPFPPTK